MSTEPRSFGHRASRAFSRLLITLIVLALFGAVAFLLSQLNARTYSLQVQGGKLLVMKGKLLPMGADPYRPSDARLADAYAPIELEGRTPGELLTQRFTDRDELDRALFTFLKDSADAKIASDDPKSLGDGLGLLQRMEKLSGITEGQRSTLKRMEAEVAFDQAKLKLDDARKEIASALEQLKLAADSQTRHAEAAHQMVSELEPAANHFVEVLRHAVHMLGGAPQGVQETPGREETPPSMGSGDAGAQPSPAQLPAPAPQTEKPSTPARPSPAAGTPAQGEPSAAPAPTGATQPSP
jgi:hypothetical protein